MTQNKMTAPVLAHRNGHKNEPTQKLNPIVPYLRGAVKLASVTMLVYMTAAAAALNVPAFLGGMLLLNALLGLYFRLEGEADGNAAKNPNCI